LLAATPKQRMNWEIAGDGYSVDWPSLNDHLTEVLLRGAPASRKARQSICAASEPWARGVSYLITWTAD
ncbi:MAG TPA: hypothetical protein VGJ51_14560, partial [Candidatus Angelobacter sp.]